MGIFAYLADNANIMSPSSNPLKRFLMRNTLRTVALSSAIILSVYMLCSVWQLNPHTVLILGSIALILQFGIVFVLLWMRVSDFIDAMHDTVKDHEIEVTALSQEKEKAIRNLAVSNAAVVVIEEKYWNLFENALEGIWQSTKDGRYSSVNPTMARMLGYDTPENLMTAITDINVQLYADPLQRTDYLAQLQENDTVTGFEAQIVRQDGTHIWISENARAVRDTDGQISHYEGTIVDITARKLLETEVKEQAEHDPLTGLLNYRAFQKRFDEESDRAQRGGGTLSIAVVNLDDFKFFSDCYGYEAGDTILCDVAARLQRCCRSYDTLARFSENEFVILMPGFGTLESDVLGDRLLTHLMGLEYCPSGGDIPVPLAVSIGLSCFPTDGATRSEALEAAFVKLRQPKLDDEGHLEADRLRASLNALLDGFSMVDALVTVVDNKDRYTRRHSEEVMVYSLQIAREMGLNTTVQDALAASALLHDVGKISISDQILRKPSQLTEDEFRTIQNHPIMGAIIVGSIPTLEHVTDGVRHHHECWDGSGYPYALSGEEIPLIARIMSVADAYSAMTSERPYRNAMEPAVALSIIERGVGAQWDPHCAEAFLNVRRRTNSESH